MKANLNPFGTKMTLGIEAGKEPGQLVVLMKGGDHLAAFQVYRLVLSFSRPDAAAKEGRMTVSFDPPEVSDFAQCIKLPPSFQALFEEREGAADVLLTITAKNTEESSLEKSLRLSDLKRIAKSPNRGVPEGMRELAPREADPPSVTSMDFSELQARKEKVGRLEEERKAKEAKKAAAAKPPQSG